MDAREFQRAMRGEMAELCGGQPDCGKDRLTRLQDQNREALAEWLKALRGFVGGALHELDKPDPDDMIAVNLIRDGMVDAMASVQQIAGQMAGVRDALEALGG